MITEVEGEDTYPSLPKCVRWMLGKSLHFSGPVRPLTSLCYPLGLLDIHKRWALVWLACLLFAAVLFLLFLIKKDHVKGEHFPAPHSSGAGLE